MTSVDVRERICVFVCDCIELSEVIGKTILFKFLFGWRGNFFSFKTGILARWPWLGSKWPIENQMVT